jgi:hypothetical protein
LVVLLSNGSSFCFSSCKIFEFVLPLFFVGILVLIKSAVQNTDGFESELIPAYYPDNENTWIPFTFTDYVTAIQAKRFCTKFDLEAYDLNDIEMARVNPTGGDVFGITGIAEQGWSWPVPFVKCDSRKCKEDGVDASDYCQYFALGLASSSETDDVGKEQRDRFGAYVMDRYRQLNADAPDKTFEFDFIQYFDSDKAVENRVKQGGYGGDVDNPKLAMAIVFDGITDTTVNYNYRLRINSTNFNAPENEGRPATSTTPPTDTSFSQYAKFDEECVSEGGTPELGNYQSSCTAQYVYNGALPLQRLIGDWIMEEMGAKEKGYYVSEHGVEYAAFPSAEYTENGFFDAIAGKSTTSFEQQQQPNEDSLRTHNCSHVPYFYYIYSICSSLDHLGSLVSRRRHYSLHCLGEGTQAEGAHVDDECDRSRYWLVLVPFLLLFSPGHGYRYYRDLHPVV